MVRSISQILLISSLIGISLSSCNRSTKTVYVDSPTDTTSDLLNTDSTPIVEIPRGQSYQSNDVMITIRDFKSLGKKMMDFGEEKEAINEWVGIFIEVKNLKSQPVRASDLYQSFFLQDLSGNEYNEDPFLGFECKDVDIDAIIQPQENFTYCSTFDAPNTPQNLYFSTYNSDYSKELKLLMN
ncbi:hypothetical protein [Picosynechococcus sp. PCC 8807]|uniref:hypothetical protein n=3 Tax=unclassified Picosynechococcus TaxID=3079910 RepID=UPI000AC7E44D|nr:hypothetical protein [Picosynechococcus sp. PCC 8807]